MKINGRPRTSIWANDTQDATHRTVSIIDQTMLPFAVEDREIVTHEQACEAIRAMRVRGAPLIGVTAAYGVALAMKEDSTDAALEQACTALRATRPTAVNLAWALDHMHHLLVEADEPDRFDLAWQEANKMADDDVATNRAIGDHGLALIEAMFAKHQRPINILTHCNAGWPATVDWGTATAPIYLAHDAGVPVHVWVDETRPRNQGLLTAWELRQHGVPHTFIVDNAGGHIMQQGKVDLVIVGADRVSRHGDVANKIGTYLKALAARDCGVPFYAALPSSTIDWQLNDAAQHIEIEERSADEVRMLRGLSSDGMLRDFRVLDDASPVANPGFDVTPARLVTGIITEQGIHTPAALAKAFNK
jgi:methylthioribose-1-phosphate isomerase